MEYLGLCVIHKGVRPINKYQGHCEYAPPKKIKGVCKSIGLINYYRDIWARVSYMIQPPKNDTFKETSIEQDKFGKIKWITSRDMLLPFT